ncbi:hypothetical protein ElyMa_005205900 [Elysia marginata]|uniref:Uncharacterized protein n=1 Tax=Elysia marginata TaxID=1093978 RepID=A0AAV4JWU5_9GAST|nr:hypothetical protein ElyMa_005205900 [Elysia marginata]
MIMKNSFNITYADLGSTPSSNVWTETEFPLPRREPILRFRQVEGLTTPIFTYAALQEDNVVRIISIKTLHAEIKNLYCVFLDFKSGPFPRFAVKASVDNIPENHNSTFTAAYISCQIDTTESKPDYVGLVPEKNLLQWPSHVIPIQGGGHVHRVSEEVSSARRPGEERGKDALRYGSNVLGCTFRDDHFFHPNNRSKLIVDPSKVDVMGIHFIWRGSGLTDNIPVQDGYLAHYRIPLLDCKPQVKDTTVVDRFGARLAERLTHVWSRLPGVALGWRPVFTSKDCPLSKEKV